MDSKELKPTSDNKGSPEYKVAVVSTENDLLRLEDDWLRLERTLPEENVFAGFDWCSAAWHYFGPDTQLGGKKELLLLVLKHTGQITGLAPFWIRQEKRWGFPWRKIEFLSGGDYNELLWDGDAATQAAVLIQHLAANLNDWETIELRDIPAESVTHHALAQALHESGLHFRIQEDDICPHLRVESSWQEFAKGLPAGQRKNLRHGWNRLEQFPGPPARARILERPQDEPNLLSKLVEVERRKLERWLTPDPVLTSSAGFYETLLRKWGPAGRVVVALLEKGDEILAYQIIFRSGRKLWCYTTGFDPAYAPCSPGLLLVPVVYQYAYERGYREYDFLTGTERYKLRWTGEFHQNIRIDIWNRRWRSRLVRYAKGFRHGA